MTFADTFTIETLREPDAVEQAIGIAEGLLHSVLVAECIHPDAAERLILASRGSDVGPVFTQHSPLRLIFGKSHSALLSSGGNAIAVLEDKRRVFEIGGDTVTYAEVVSVRQTTKASTPLTSSSRYTTVHIQ